ncbi:MAG: hypothetical protein MZW92_76380 [Comamonadaceae bacterium]|nr:hypothetical protein [Comamonadaceae bacterium]
MLEAGNLRHGRRPRTDRAQPRAHQPARGCWQAHLAHRPDADELAACAATPGLTPGRVRKLSERLDWLRRNPELDLRPKEPL